jgi:hypothetical protein
MALTFYEWFEIYGDDSQQTARESGADDCVMDDVMLQLFQEFSDEQPDEIGYDDAVMYGGL